MTICDYRLLRLLLALLLVSAPFPSAMLQAQELKWATSARSGATDLGWGIATDSFGNIYVTGGFLGTVTFGAGEANETVLEPVRSDDMFVAKYAPDGTLLWAKSAGGAGSDVGRAIATDSSGNSYVTGSIDETATFGAGEANETVLEASFDMFVAKYAPDGTLLWATSAGGASFDPGFGIATDPLGNSYVTGKFVGTATFGAGEANQTVLEAVGNEAVGILDMFVAKYALDGTLLWATSAGGVLLDSHNSGIATDARGNIYVTGNIFGTATFGAGEANETVLEAGNRPDVFVAKYASAGTLLWATSAGGVGSDAGYAIATDPLGNSYMTGSFQSTAIFGAGEEHETVLSNSGIRDIFVAKYAPDGSLLWATSAGGAGQNFGNGISTDPSGNSYVTGWSFFGTSSGTVTFGAGEANQTVLEGASHHMFVAKYAPDGSLLWATGVAGTGQNASNGIATDARGNIYVTGWIDQTATFGAEPNETVLTSVGGSDIFVAKYSTGEVKDGDDDTDGVFDEVDFCPGTVLPEAVPTSGRLLPNRFALTGDGPGQTFATGGRGQTRQRFTIFDTRGCSCEQIIDHLGLGQGHRAHGCSIGVMRNFIRQLP
jgi:hypothetical protein